MAPIVANQRLSMRCNAALLQNQGNCNIVLDNGFTLEPGQSYTFGNYAEVNTVKIDVQVIFQPATVPPEQEPIFRLEVVEMLTAITGNGYYIDQPPLTIEPPKTN